MKVGVILLRYVCIDCLNMFKVSIGMLNYGWFGYFEYIDGVCSN